MAKSDFLPQNPDEFAAQMRQVKQVLPGYALVLEVSPADVASQAADSDCFSYVLACERIFQATGSAWTTWRRSLRSQPDAAPGDGPGVPVLPPAPPMVLPGIESRFRSLVRRIRAHPACNPGIEAALGIAGADHAPPDLTTIQPVLVLSLIGNQVNVGWGWGGKGPYLDMCEIQVDRSDGLGFVLLIFDTTPGYIDPAPLPAAPVRWKYRAIYRVGDNQVGQWSSAVGITVGGE